MKFVTICIVFFIRISLVCVTKLCPNCKEEAVQKNQITVNCNKDGHGDEESVRSISVWLSNEDSHPNRVPYRLIIQTAGNLSRIITTRIISRYLSGLRVSHRIIFVCAINIFTNLTEIVQDTYQHDSELVNLLDTILY